MKYLTTTILLLVLLLIECSANHADAPEASQQNKSAMIHALENAIQTTPYSALIQQISVDTISVPDANPNDDYVEEKHIYHASVLETYRGRQLKNISYEMVIEKGETTVINGTPVVITLCAIGEKFYWPGVGSLFPATEEVVKTAQRISKEGKFIEHSFPNCE